MENLEVTKNTIEDELLRMDPKLNRDDETFKAAVILMFGTLNNKCSTYVLAEYLNYDQEFVRKIVRNIKSEKIWSQNTARDREENPNKIQISDWFDDQNGGINFWLDVSRAMGYITAN